VTFSKCWFFKFIVYFYITSKTEKNNKQQTFNIVQCCCDLVWLSVRLYTGWAKNGPLLKVYNSCMTQGGVQYIKMYSSSFWIFPHLTILCIQRNYTTPKIPIHLSH